ncbi:hypothetical protein UUU_25610 [Klebsiella pneumoniae subsp. pneumoniae DSM 30104 = JCM 1662 = NBRC 14940]|nr:hypothetical protein UUU_25610 [Klebsiella pneumoniae subsp. pneumoniae DSM 30104 = JCM 1662 = NBRC 14940]
MTLKAVHLSLPDMPNRTVKSFLFTLAVNLQPILNTSFLTTAPV